MRLLVGNAPRSENARPHGAASSRKAVLGLIAVLGLAWSGSRSPGAEIEHVVLIGLDGCRPEAIRRAGGPVLKALCRDGACAWNAQAERPSVTQVNWASILTGSTPAKHGITAAAAEPERLGHVRVPTAFEAVAAQGRKAAGFLGHWKLYPVESEDQAPNLHFEHSPYEARAAARVAAEFIERERPAFCFVYMGDLDGAGHRHGWLSPEQLARMEEIDAAIGRLITALERAGIRSKTLLIVTSDHGGHGRAHGQGTPEDLTVPWICSGPGVRHGYEIHSPLPTRDTAPTVLQALGLPIPPQWDGRPRREIFEAPAADGPAPCTGSPPE